MLRTQSQVDFDVAAGSKRPDASRVPLRKRYHSLHLVRVGAFHSTGVHGSSGVVISLARLNGAIAVAQVSVQR